MNFGLDTKMCIPAGSSEYYCWEAVTLLKNLIPWDLMTVFSQVIKQVFQNILCHHHTELPYRQLLDLCGEKLLALLAEKWVISVQQVKEIILTRNWWKKPCINSALLLIFQNQECLVWAKYKTARDWITKNTEIPVEKRGKTLLSKLGTFYGQHRTQGNRHQGWKWERRAQGSSHASLTGTYKKRN